MKLRFLWPLPLFLALVAALGFGLRLEPGSLPSPLIGREMPAFELAELRDTDRRLASADLVGQPVLFNVWASWCVTCLAEHPVLMELKRAGIPIYGLNYKDSRAEALRFLDRHGDPYRAIGFDADGNVGIDWGVYATPETFVLDRHGVVRFKHTGRLTPELVEETVIPLYRRLEAES
ncbi:MAG TPA: DsbE family thiol:disulfide interchange protein [Thioalkalivibrio sp.]|nr:DsbE family thiol:disulfide interchange protein [Thioalkalivibrio sp.]